MSEQEAVGQSKQEAQPRAVALFVSDVHLQPALSQTVDKFLHFLHEHAPNAQYLFLLGDLFEYWVGDDDLVAPLHRQVADALASLASDVQVGWIGGNRDFLVGRQFAAAARLHLLPDPFVTELAGLRIVLTHGDAQCTDDLSYQAFRDQVRDPAWQQQFLAQPLAQRRAIVQGMREGSRAAQREKSCAIMDVNELAIIDLFSRTDAQVMIHGHTHRPACHLHEVSGRQRVRHVLPDWDCETDPTRGGWLALQGDGSFLRYDANGRRLP